jgi:hypothetical protein
MYRAVLARLDQGMEQTLGRFTLFKGLDRVFDCVTLELPWEENYTNISCVPIGVYKVSPRYSEKYKNHYILEDVPNRRYILIHHGNFNADTRGCILLGSSFAQINGDAFLDITASRRTISELLSITNGKGFELTIV